MAVVAKARPKRILWLVGYAVLSAVLGVWGAYDYWVRIPQAEQDYSVYAESLAIVERFQKNSDTATTAALTPTELAEYDQAKFIINSVKDGGAPEMVAVYDRPLQLWVYVVGCGLLGAPWCIWSTVKLRRQRLELDGNGELFFNESRLPHDRIQSIDMSRWMSKSIAIVHGTGGETIKVDDYMMENAHLIVGRIANRFLPDQWNTDGTRVKPPEAEEDPPSIANGEQTSASSDEHRQNPPLDNA